MKAKELRLKTDEELSELLLKERARLRDLYFRLSGAQLKSVHEINEAKRNIAIILTTFSAKSGSASG